MSGGRYQAIAREEARDRRAATMERYGTETPTIACVVQVVDHGPCDGGEASAYCPHCGAGGRYIHHAITSDGGHVAAMAGCIQLFPQDPRYALASKLTAEANKRARDADRDGKRLASWWAEIASAGDALAWEETTPEAWRETVLAAERRRQAWLARNGYGRSGSRQRR